MAKQYRVGCKSLDEFGRGVVTFNNKKFAVPYLLPGEKGNMELVYKAAEAVQSLFHLMKHQNQKTAWHRSVRYMKSAAAAS